MRSLTKHPIPDILSANEIIWLAEYKSDKASSVKKYRYRHESIKEVLKNETAHKCVYCESKIGHNTPGDIEHKIPSSKNIDLHFTWSNLTIACTECNRRKNDYYKVGEEFLDPYQDSVEDLVEHHGPIAYWTVGNVRAEISIRILELNSKKRKELIFNKIEKLEEVQNLYERFNSQSDPVLKHVEKPLLDQLNGIGWEIIDLDSKQHPGDSFRQSFTEVVMLPVLRRQLKVINPWLEDDQIEEVIKQLTASSPSNNLIQNNRHVFTLLLENTSVREPIGSGLSS